MNKYGNLQKYQNSNHLQRWLIGKFLDLASNFIAGLTVNRSLDVGSGEGFVSKVLLDQGQIGSTIAIDIDAVSLKQGQALHPLLHFGQGNAYKLPFADQTFDLVICTEVLEHMEEPELLLQELKRVTRSYCLLSVPHEPFFCAANFLRGKHIKQWGNDPEHINHWGQSSFIKMVGCHFNLVKTQTTFPWIMVLTSR